jgi:hypothetical protein
MPRDHLLDEDGLGLRDALDGLARHWIRQESDEIAGVARLHGDADLAVRLEAADARPVAGTRVDHDKRPALHVDLDALGRDDTHQRIIDGLLELAAVDDQFRRIAQDVRRRLGNMFAVLVAALTHDVQEQHRALPGIDHVFDRLCDQSRHRTARQFRLIQRHVSILLPVVPIEGAPDGVSLDLGQSGPGAHRPCLGPERGLDAGRLLRYRTPARWTKR